MSEIPKCPRYVAHPQAVWFEEHWRPIIEKLKAENANLKQALELNRQVADAINDNGQQVFECQQLISKLTRQVEILKKALEFYADKKSYKIMWTDDDGNLGSLVFFDQGLKAEESLKECEGVK